MVTFNSTAFPSAAGPVMETIMTWSRFWASYASDPQFAVGSSLDNPFGSQSFSYQNNTWYRLVIQALPGQDIRVPLDDESGTELVGQTLNHTEGAFGSGFELALSQAMGFPQGTYSSDVAVDYVSLAAVPEPGSVLLTVTGLGLLGLVGRCRSVKSRG